MILYSLPIILTNSPMDCSNEIATLINRYTSFIFPPVTYYLGFITPIHSSKKHIDATVQCKCII